MPGTQSRKISVFCVLIQNLPDYVFIGNCVFIGLKAECGARYLAAHTPLYF